jgi:hypothetical protein
MEQQALFGFGQLTKRWGVSRDTLVRAAKRADLRTVCLAGRRLVPRSEVERVELVGFGGGRKKAAPKGHGEATAEARA